METISDDTKYKEFITKCVIDNCDETGVRYEVFFSCEDCGTEFSIMSNQIISALLKAENNRCPTCDEVKNIKLTHHIDNGTVADVVRTEINELNTMQRGYRETTYIDFMMWTCTTRLPI